MRAVRSTGILPVSNSGYSRNAHGQDARATKILASLIVGALLAGCDRPAPTPVTQHLTLAAAADLRGALQELSAAFEKSHPHTKIDPTFGSSGTFYSQLTAKAPFDLFLSADSAYPAKLIEQGLAKPDAVFKYAVGHIVVWTRKGSGIDVSKGLAVLTSDGVKKIAIANPRHAPYGRAAEAALRSAGLYETVAPKLVLGENIAEAAQFAQTGSADVGIIALSLATGMDGDYAEVPPDLYPKLEQSGVILPWATNAKLAADFRDFLTSPDARAVLKRRGFSEP